LLPTVWLTYCTSIIVKNKQQWSNSNVSGDKIHHYGLVCERIKLLVMTYWRLLQLLLPFSLLLVLRWLLSV